jgi:hypothetical protein
MKYNVKFEWVDSELASRICPHCGTTIHTWTYFAELATRNNSPPLDAVDRQGKWSIQWMICPDAKCRNIIVWLVLWPKDGIGTEEILVYPRTAARRPAPPSVPAAIAKDYREACLVLKDSPNASAALSRRCLQHVLTEAGKTTKNDLADQIDEVLLTLPGPLRSMIDTVRTMGNFAAHPKKSTNTAEIIEVEPEEAEWLLETLESAFDFYYVQPAEIQRKRDAINAKLKDAKKPPLK